MSLLHLDLDKLIESRLLIQANSGGGKSHAIRWLAEKYHGKAQQIIIDREGEFATLREKFPYLLVGRDGDIAADIRSAKLLARKLMELELSAVIDLSEMSLFQQKEYVRTFLESINHLTRDYWKDCLIVIDEAHLFAPEKGKGSSAATEAIAMLLSTGRKRGYCAVLATQRLAKLDKDCASECLNKLIGRTSNEDGKRAADELNQGKEGRLNLRSLSPGEFWAYGPAISIEPILVRTGSVVTSPPKRGTARSPAPAPQAAIKKVLAELAELPKEAADEEQSVANMQRRIVDLERELQRSNRDLRAKIGVVTPDSVMINHAVKAATSKLQAQANALSATSTKRWQQMGRHVGKTLEMAQIAMNAVAEGATVFAIESPMKELADIQMAPWEPKTKETKVRDLYLWEDAKRIERNSPEQRILNAIAAFNQLGIDPVVKANVAFFAGYTVNGHFNNTVGKMRASGLIDYPRPGYLALTEDGTAQSKPDSHPIRSLDDLHRIWLGKFRGPERRIMEVVLEGGRSFSATAAELASLAGYTVNGHFNNTLGHLRSLGVITKRGNIQATEILYPEGLK